jgi:hypothetical protein
MGLGGIAGDRRVRGGGRSLRGIAAVDRRLRRGGLSGSGRNGESGCERSIRDKVLHGTRAWWRFGSRLKPMIYYRKMAIG